MQNINSFYSPNEKVTISANADDLSCSTTLTPTRHPIVISDGTTCEASALLENILKHGLKSPNTRKPITSATYNLALANIMNANPHLIRHENYDVTPVINEINQRIHVANSHNLLFNLKNNPLFYSGLNLLAFYFVCSELYVFACEPSSPLQMQRFDGNSCHQFSDSYSFLTSALFGMSDYLVRYMTKGNSGLISAGIKGVRTFMSECSSLFFIRQRREDGSTNDLNHQQSYNV